MDRIFHRCYLIALLGFFLTALAWLTQLRRNLKLKSHSNNALTVLFALIVHATAFLQVAHSVSLALEGK